MNTNNKTARIIEKAWRWLQDIPWFWRSLLSILIFLTIGLILEQIAFTFVLRSSEEIQPWDPAAGWNVFFLLCFGLRYGFVIPFISILESIFLRPQETFLNGIVNGINIAFFLTACTALLLSKADFDPRLSRLQDIVRFALFYGFGTLLYAFSDVNILIAMGEIDSSNWFGKIMHEWAGEATGIVMLAPPLLILSRQFSWSDKRIDIKGLAPKIKFNLPKLKNTLDWLLLFAVTIFFTWAAHGGIRSNGLDYAYLIFIPLCWISAWKGFESATVITLLINVLAVLFVNNKGTIESKGTIALQFSLLTVTYIGLLLSAVVSSRKEENTKREELEKQLRYDATHDSLTKLYNRSWFLKRLKKINKKTQQDKNYLFALLFLDLDRFKLVNDSLGHITGDRLLKKVAKTLRDCLPKDVSIARLGGDEFVILLEQIQNEAYARQIAQTVCQNIEQTYKIDKYQVFMTASIGVAYGSGSLENLNILRNADIALYEAKACGRSQYVVFDSQMYDRVATRAWLEQDLRQAIKELNA